MSEQCDLSEQSSSHEQMNRVRFRNQATSRAHAGNQDHEVQLHQMHVANAHCAATGCMRQALANRPCHSPLRMNCVRHTVMAAAQRDAKQLLRKTVKQALRQMDKAEGQRQSEWYNSLRSCALQV